MLWQLAASGWALAVGVTDWRTRRIPNALLLPGLVLAAAAVMGARAPVGPVGAAIAAAIALALLMPGYLLGKTGAGDMKCLAVMGACVGVVAVIEVFLLASVLFGVFCAVRMARQRLDPAGEAVPATPPAGDTMLPMGPALVAAFLRVVWSGPWFLPRIV